MAANPIRRSTAKETVAAENPHAIAPRLSGARCLLFAYHEIGYGCMEALLKMGVPVAGLFSHDDDSHEEIWWRSCADLARRHGVPVYTPERLDAPWIERIVAMRPAIIYSFYYRNLLPEALLRIAPLGAYNLHGSLLPAYRGRAPVNWMLVNGEREAGVTLHHMVARADAGDIVAQRAVAIDDRDTALTLYRKLVPLGVTLLTRDASADRGRVARHAARRIFRAGAISDGAVPKTGGSIGDGRHGASSTWCAP